MVGCNGSDPKQVLSSVRRGPVVAMRWPGLELWSSFKSRPLPYYPVACSSLRPMFGNDDVSV